MSVNASRAMNIEPQNKEPQNFEEGIFLFYMSKQSVANPHFDIRYSLFDIRYSNNIVS